MLEHAVVGFLKVEIPTLEESESVSFLGVIVEGRNGLQLVFEDEFFELFVHLFFLGREGNGLSPD